MFCAQHTGIDRIAPATDIAPEYAVRLTEAAGQGVKILGCKVEFKMPYVRVKRLIAVDISGGLATS
jgi:sugar fermentation stimulation protein A